MFCVKCGKEVQGNWKICPFCGSEVVQRDSAKRTDEKQDVEEKVVLAENRKEISEVHEFKEIKRENNSRYGWIVFLLLAGAAVILLLVNSIWGDAGNNIKYSGVKKQMKQIVVLKDVCEYVKEETKGFDAAKYVESCLDLLTKGEIEGYVEMTKRSEEQAWQDYEENIDSMIEVMGVYGLSAELAEGYKQLFKDIYANTRYEVIGSERMNGRDGYIVTVEVEQMTGLFNGLQEELMVEVENYVSGLMWMPTDAEINNTVYWMMLDLLRGRFGGTTYKDPQIITVEVVSDGNVYYITDEGYTALDNALLDVTM